MNFKFRAAATKFDLILFGRTNVYGHHRKRNYDHRQGDLPES